MNNIIKMLSANKDFRMVIADTHQISEKALNEFTGTHCIRKFLEQIITNCTLLSAINDFNAKISFSFRLSQGVSIFCQITDSKFSIEYKDKLNEFDGTVADLFDDKSVVSITTGNWETGLHTGTVEAYMDSVVMLFSHFTVQSEQLPSHFIMAGDNSSRGLLMQPLPFADEKLISKSDDELVYLSKELEQMNWSNVANMYSHLANVISENKIE
ncbi:Hsp33 family molecular chaperone HslO [Paenibacillus dokdonensis]|uniref:Hsp33 family molecular chaperone HslO n=1 Tax=Paenibacillus dokdonensis TaxID=2567944 RepID=A0ABU6GNF8_9BACL|nr:Hsp33 family molecular chaperone HslO [Paenibacillus dokdonensis]MEC0240642.1 Hsp33 family molecular chaperone HslO [Paenibacillus dokdonensis]